jgi:hypothetical protein
VGYGTSGKYRSGGLENALKDYQGRKGVVRNNGLKELENAGYGKGTNRLNAAKADAAHSARVGKWMGRGGGALSFGAGMYSQYGESKKAETSKAKIGAEMAVTGGLAATGGWAGGAAAGALAGLACGPGAPVCSTVGAIGGAIILGGGLAYLGTNSGMAVNELW